VILISVRVPQAGAITKVVNHSHLLEIGPLTTDYTIACSKRDGI
jgi:hypothetical protein